MKLSELLKQNIPKKADIDISGITRDSRLVQPNDVYCALKGDSADGANFIEQAIANGAIAVLRHGSAFSVDYQNLIGREIPVLTIPELSTRLGIISAEFYGNPSQKLEVIAVTGTNGKTSTAIYTAQMLMKLGMPCGVIGTLGSGLPNNIIPSTLTTPDPISLQRKLAEFVDQGIKAVAMEASSQGLLQHRLSGVAVDVAIFTNLTHEHLDYHLTMENYKQAKRLLFTDCDAKYAIINMDDACGRELIQELAPRLLVYGYSITGKQMPGIKHILAGEFQRAEHGFSTVVDTPWGKGQFASHLLGQFNLSNLLAVITVLGIMGFSFTEIIKKLPEVVAVAGRMQAFGGGDKPLVVVDFAHTPDALEQVLTELRAHAKGKLWCVFGCGGGRDGKKRPMMGLIAERLADQIVLTNDNPRSEEPEFIINEILAGMVCPWAAEVELDRQAAIMHAINCAKAEDVVLIAGKGHELHQIIGGKTIPFNDSEIVKAQLELL